MIKRSLRQRLIDLLPFKSKIWEWMLGGEDLELSEVQLLLFQIGYLPEEYERGQLDELTRQALTMFQKFYKLDLTGDLTAETMKFLKSPRCGNADLPEPRLVTSEFGRAAFDAFVPMNLVPDLSRGCSFHNVTTLTYAILKNPARGGLTSDQVKSIIDAAFNTWGRAIPINFNRVEEADNPSFKLTWATGDHGDGVQNIFDNSIRLHAHAFYPPDCNEPFTGQCHFNDNHIWGLGDDPSRRTFDLQSVALHEIGHLLGLRHSDDENSIMVSDYKGNRRELTGDALASIQRIYGVRGQA